MLNPLFCYKLFGTVTELFLTVHNLFHSNGARAAPYNWPR